MKKKLLLTGYIAAITILFLYMLFPTDAVTSYINYRLSDSMPGFHITIDRIRPSFPPGFNFQSPVLFRQDQELFKMDQIYIRPAYTTLFSPTKSFIFNCSTYGGDIHGNVDFTADKSLIDSSLVIKNVEVKGIPAIREVSPHSVSGIINGNMAFNNTPPFGNGKAELSITGGQIDFKPALLGMEELRLDTIDANIDMSNGQIKINKLNVKGRDLNGNAQGSMNLRKPIGASSINFAGQVFPKPSLMKNLSSVFPIAAIAGKNSATRGIPFKISGTLDNPNFSLK